MFSCQHYSVPRGQETHLLQKWWPSQNNVHLWRQPGSLYIQRASSAGTVASSLVAHQTTSIHQHKSAQRGANCIRRPSPFLSGLCVWSREGWGVLCGVEARGKEQRRGLARTVGCLRSRGGRVWRWVVGVGQAPQAFKQASPQSPLQLLATSPAPPPPPNSHKQNKYKGHDRLASCRSLKTTEFTHLAFHLNNFAFTLFKFSPVIQAVLFSCSSVHIRK